MENYIDKFERVVDLLRTTGGYTSAVLTGTIHTITSDTDIDMAVKDYVLFNGTVKARVTEVVSLRVFKVDAQGSALEDLGTWKAMAPYTDYGSKRTINQKLIEKNGYEFKYQKYPLIALRLPVVISGDGALKTMDANVLIAVFTNKQYKPQERIANTFKPVLWPLAQRFLDMCKSSGEFNNFNLDYTQRDRMFYATEAGDDNIANVFDDPLDAVEFTNLRLRFIVDDCDSSVSLASEESEGGFPYVFERVFES